MRHARASYNHRFQDSENLIPEDEPVFLLRAQDPVAASVVRLWADETEQRGGDPAIVKAARDHADEMDLWPIKKKVADLSREDRLALQMRETTAEDE